MSEQVECLRHFSKQKTLILGPALFLCFALFPIGGLELSLRVTFGTVCWMALWFITQPVSSGITGLLPIAINALFNLVDMGGILKCYAAEIIILVASANIITRTWHTTGVEKRIAAVILSSIGTSVKAHTIVWLLLATVLSSVLPNSVVAAMLCAIAYAMLDYIGKGDLRSSKSGTMIMLAIVWGACTGGMGTPLGGAMNLVSVGYIEQITEQEMMYSAWVWQLLPFFLGVTAITLAALLSVRYEEPQLGESRHFFQKLSHSFPKMTAPELASLLLFLIPTVLTFTRQLYANTLPGLKPAYAFAVFAILALLLPDGKGGHLQPWNDTMHNLQWDLIFLIAGGNAMGILFTGTGADQLLARLIADGGTSEFTLILIIVAFNVILSDFTSATACASVALPVVLSVTHSLGLPPLPYILITSVAFNVSFTMPTNIRGIPLAYGLDPKQMFKLGAIQSLLAIALISSLGYLFIRCWPAFGVL